MENIHKMNSSPKRVPKYIMTTIQSNKKNSSDNINESIQKDFYLKPALSNNSNKSSLNHRDKSKPLPIIIAPKSFTPTFDKSVTSFVSFHDLIDNMGDNFKELQNDQFFDQNPTSRNMVKQQLQFNKKQEQKFIDNTNRTWIDSNKDLMENIKIKEKKEKHMPFIKVFPGRKRNGISKIFYKSNKTENNETSDESKASSPSRKFAFLSLINSYHFHWYKANELNLWKPEIREGASLVIEGRFGYLYGGLGQRLIEDMLILDTSKGIISCNMINK